MKAFTAAAAMAVAASALDQEFMRGAQTGFFITSDDQLLDYDCEPLRVDPEVQNKLDMANSMRIMMENMNKNKDQEIPMQKQIDWFFEHAELAGELYSLFSGSYEGGQFCRGLYLSHEGRQVFNQYAGNMMANLFTQ